MSKKLTKGNIGVFKDKLIKSNKIEIRASNISGYGVFATDVIEKGEIIEECVMAKPTDNDYPHLESLIYRFVHYSFEGETLPIFITGVCGLFNHSSNNNIEIEQDLEYERIVRIIATKRITKNTELFSDYGWDPSEGEENIQNYDE